MCFQNLPPFKRQSTTVELSSDTLWHDSLVFSEENCQDTFRDYNNAYHSISQRIHVALFICVITHGLTRNNSGLIVQTAVHNMQMNINKTKHKPPE